jgi:glycosyltransferase involved in cell wall biosynthesis
VIPEKVHLVTASAGAKLRYLIVAFIHAFKPCELIICGHINLLPLAALMARFKRVPLVLQVHGIDVWRPVPSARRWLSCIDAIWSVSSVTRDRMNEWANLPLSRYTVIPNTLHFEHYGLAPRREDLLEQYGFKGRKVIVSMGRLASCEQYKGFDELLDAMPALIAHEPSLGYLIIGDGDDRQRLEARVKSMGLSDHVRFTGYVDGDEKADHLRLGDVFAMPGKGEGFGIVYLEAMACGIPVVGSRLDGSREALLDGKLGELVNPEDSASLLNGILKALVKPLQIPEGLDHFFWENYTQRIKDAFMNVIKNRSINRD